MGSIGLLRALVNRQFVHGVHSLISYYNYIISLLINSKEVRFIIQRITYCVIFRNMSIGGDMSIAFIQELARRGYRVFKTEDAREVATFVGLKNTYVPRLLSHLVQKKVITPLMRGHYAISNTLLPGSPLHPYEIAMSLIQPGALSCWTAMIYHGLSDQMVNRTFIMTPYLNGSKRSSMNSYTVDYNLYVLIRVNLENYWGIERHFVDSTPIYITDLERTLCDGLIRPKYCGGISEVIHAFQKAGERIHGEKLYEYLQKCPTTVRQRCGWILSNLNLLKEVQSNLLKDKKEFKSYTKLNSDGENSKKKNSTWKIMENIYCASTSSTIKEKVE
jgi:predicted transcriptional regulator of viral defense system